MAEQTEEVQALLEQIAQADEDAKARYFAEVFSLLMNYDKFVKFVEQNYIIEHGIDKDSGVLYVNVEEIPAAPKSEAEEAFAEAFNAVKE